MTSRPCNKEVRNAHEISAAMMNLSKEIPQVTEALRKTYAAIEQLHDAERRLEDEVARFKESGNSVTG